MKKLVLLVLVSLVSSKQIPEQTGRAVSAGCLTPCQNGAKCVQNGSGFTCKCEFPWVGPSCTIRVPPPGQGMPKMMSTINDRNKKDWDNNDGWQGHNDNFKSWLDKWGYYSEYSNWPYNNNNNGWTMWDNFYNGYNNNWNTNINGWNNFGWANPSWNQQNLQNSWPNNPQNPYNYNGGQIGCASSPCQNSGRCEAGSSLLGYTCNCPFSYYGTYCEMRNGGAIAGVVLGTVIPAILIFLLVLAVVFYMRRKKEARNNNRKPIVEN